MFDVEDFSGCTDTTSSVSARPLSDNPNLVQAD
jgi:hypothetical protein